MPNITRWTVALVLAVGVVTGASADVALEAYQSGDFDTARTLWLEQATQGSAAAQFNIGLLHHQGKGGEVDFAEALQWYERAANNGYPRAQFEAAAMYEAGRGTEPDLVRAHMWYSLAADRRYSGARKARRRVAKQLDDRQIAQSEMRARMLKQEWKQNRRSTE